MTGKSSLCFLLAAASSQILCYFQWCCPLCPWTSFLICVTERLTETTSLTSTFISTALSATLWSRDDSTAFHLTRFRTAGRLEKWLATTRRYPQCLQSHFNVPFQNASELQGEPKSFLCSSKVSCSYNTPLCPSWSPFRSSLPVVGHWGVKLGIADQFQNSNFTWKVPGDRVMDG